jgi:hypothetical protein
MNGTFNSGGQFNRKIIKSMPSLSQYLLSVNPKHGLTWNFEINLDKINEESKIENYGDIIK